MNFTVFNRKIRTALTAAVTLPLLFSPCTRAAKNAPPLQSIDVTTHQPSQEKILVCSLIWGHCDCENLDLPTLKLIIPKLWKKYLSYFYQTQEIFILKNDYSLCISSDKLIKYRNLIFKTLQTVIATVEEPVYVVAESSAALAIKYCAPSPDRRNDYDSPQAKAYRLGFVNSWKNGGRAYEYTKGKDISYWKNITKILSKETRTFIELKYNLEKSFILKSN